MKRKIFLLLLILPSLLAAQIPDSAGSKDPVIISENLLFPDELINEDIGMKVFPNPTSKNATLQLRLHAPLFLTIDIINQEGVVVKVITSKKFNGQDPSVYIDTSGLPAGLYMIRVLSEAGSVMASKNLKVVR